MATPRPNAAEQKRLAKRRRIVNAVGALILPAMLVANGLFGAPARDDVTPGTAVAPVVVSTSTPDGWNS